MEDSFSKAVAFVLKQAGRYVHDDNPLDAVSRGIQGRTYDAWRRSQGLPERPVRELEEAEAQAIYRTLWEACGSGVLLAPLDIVHFDAAAMHGLDQAGGWMVRALPHAQADLDPRGLAIRLLEIREEAMHRSAQRPKNADKLRGWLLRLTALRLEAALPTAE